MRVDSKKLFHKLALVLQRKRVNFYQTWFFKGNEGIYISLGCSKEKSEFISALVLQRKRGNLYQPWLFKGKERIYISFGYSKEKKWIYSGNCAAVVKYDCIYRNIQKALLGFQCCHTYREICSMQILWVNLPMGACSTTTKVKFDQEVLKTDVLHKNCTWIKIQCEGHALPMLVCKRTGDAHGLEDCHCQFWKIVFVWSGSSCSDFVSY